MQKINLDSSDKQVLLSIGEASEYLGISIDTLRRWEKKNKITALRSPGGHRYFKRKDLDNLFGRKYERTEETKKRKIEKETKANEVTDNQKFNPISVEEIVEREPREVKIPPLSSIRVIKDQNTLFQTQTESLDTRKPQIPVPASTQPSVLTPQAITAKPQQVMPISSVPPAAQYKQDVRKKKSNAWIYLVFGLVLLIVGFTIFVIFRSPSEVISPVP